MLILQKLTIFQLKNKRLFTLTILFFLTLSTSYYWEGKLGLITFPVFIILVIIYLGLGISLFRQIHLFIKEKYAVKSRLINIWTITLVLMLTFSKPFVFLKNYFLMEFVGIESGNVLVANRYCESKRIETFKLKSNFTFSEKNVCYGVSEVRGTYRISNDTIFFENVKRGKQEDIQYEFGVIEELETYTEHKYALNLYKNRDDNTGFYYYISRNDLHIQPLIKPNR